MENEELDEIDYYEIVSYDEIIKFNPTFVAFSDEEIYNHLFTFFQNKEKSENFLKLFSEIIYRQKNPNQFKNLIIVADAKRGDFSNENFDISEFVNKIKNSNKEQILLGYKNKNKLWFPLIYDDESPKLKYRANSTTIINLNTNDNFIIFKDDERDIPIMGVYFYEPKVDDNSELSHKICSHLIKDNERFKGDLLESDNSKSFNDFISKYKILFPLNKIDEDDYNYNSLNNLLRKYNYDLDYIQNKDFELLKDYLENLNKKEKQLDIKYSIIKNKPIYLKNDRFIFYSILKKTFGLIDITLNSAKKFQSELDTLKRDKVFIDPLPLHKDLSLLISNINNDNYNDIINNLRDIRKNLSIDNCINAYNGYLKLDIDQIKTHFEKIENKFNLLLNYYKDLYVIDFSFEKEEKEIKIGNDTKDYEGIPVKVDEYKKNVVYIDDDDDNDDILMIEDTDKTTELNKYYNNYYYNLEQGFAQSLKIILPFLMKLSELSRLPIDLKVICNHLFNIHRGIPEKYQIIRNKYKDKYDESHCKEKSLIPINKVLTDDNEDQLLKDANIEYIDIITIMLYDAICKWSIDLQNELINETLLYSKDIYYIPCYDLWNEFGAPYDMQSKDGILYYIICIFEDVFKETYSENDIIYLPLDKGYKAKIINRMLENYQDDLKKFIKDDSKKKKENKGIEAQKKLAKFLLEGNYKDDKFFETFIQSLIYMPSVKFEKIHKYLLGCCLEQLDSEFTADKFFKTNRKDLQKAKSKFSSDRVLNKERYKRFYLFKSETFERKKGLDGIKYESLKYPIYEKSLDKWFKELDDTTILSNSNIIEIKSKLLQTFEFHRDEFLISVDKKFKDFKNFNFINYRQILISVSTILFKFMENKALSLINKINNTIQILDKLNSIINDDNENDIYQIRTIIVIRAICLPSIPDMKKPINLNSYISIDINKETYIKIMNEIKSKIYKVIQDSKMPNEEERTNYINELREENKKLILDKFDKKTLDEKNILKQLKDIGLDYVFNDDDDIIKEVNKEITDADLDIEGEAEFELDVEDDEMENYDRKEYGFIYAN